MMLMDASAILKLVRTGKELALDLLEGNALLTLTPYEVGNALWKGAKLLGRITLEEAMELQETMVL